MQQFLKYPLIFFTGFLTTYFLTPYLIKFAKNRGIVELPDVRRIHSMPMPNIGGIAVFIGFHAVCLVIFLIPWMPFNSTLSREWWITFFVLSSLLLIIGIIDDIWSISWMIKLIGQVTIAVLSFAGNIRVTNILGYSLPWIIDLLVTVFWIVALINAFNLIDGIDGLAVGLASISSCGIAGSLLFRHLPGDALVLLGFLGACLAFLRFNYYPAKIFLGDSGSMFLGYTLATVALSTASKGTAMASIGVPLLAVGIPVFDTMLAIWRRSVRGMVKKSFTGTQSEVVMEADMDHLHHRLLKLGLSQKNVALVLYAINSSLVFVGLLSLTYRSHALGIYLISFVVASYLIVRHLARIELWDSGTAILEGLHKPPVTARAVLIYPVLDCLLLSIALAISIFIIHVQMNPLSWLAIKKIWFDSLPIQIGIPFLALVLSRTYSRVWSRARISEFAILTLVLLAGILVSCGLCVFVCQGLGQEQIFLQSIVYGGISIPLLTGSRAFLRTVQDLMSMLEERNLEKHEISSKILLYGAGSKATLYLRQKSYRKSIEGGKNVIIGFLDDDLNLRKRLVHGYRILGNIQEAEVIIDKFEIDEVVITSELRETSLRKLLGVATAKNLRVSKWQTNEILIYNALGKKNKNRNLLLNSIKN